MFDKGIPDRCHLGSGLTVDSSSETFDRPLDCLVSALSEVKDLGRGLPILDMQSMPHGVTFVPCYVLGAA